MAVYKTHHNKKRRDQACSVSTKKVFDGMEDNCDNISARGNIKPLGMTEKYAGAMSKLCKAL